MKLRRPIFSTSISGAEVSKTFRHWCLSVSLTLRHQCKNLRHFGTKHMVPKCLGSEVS